MFWMLIWTLYKRHTLIIDGEENFSSLLNCLFIIQVCSTQHLLDVYSQTLVCMEKDGIKTPPSMHLSEGSGHSSACFFWHWLVPYSRQSGRVVFIFMLQQKTGKWGEGQLKRPWPEPFAVAVTFIASHIISKLSNKHFTVDTWTNWAGFHLLLCLTTFLGSVQSGFHSPLCLTQWIMPL